MATTHIIGVCLGFRFMVFNVTFNNISVISGQSVLMVEETGLPGENHHPVASH
jgi:hypothetical protein